MRTGSSLRGLGALSRSVMKWDAYWQLGSALTDPRRLLGVEECRWSGGDATPDARRGGVPQAAHALPQQLWRMGAGPGPRSAHTDAVPQASASAPCMQGRVRSRVSGYVIASSGGRVDKHAMRYNEATCKLLRNPCRDDGICADHNIIPFKYIKIV